MYAVLQMSTVMLYTSPGVMSTGVVLFSLHFILKIPSDMSMLLPSGHTSVNFAVKSVSVAVLDTKRLANKWPVTAVVEEKGALVKTRTSSRVSSEDWSHGPHLGSTRLAPPRVGTGFVGS